MRDNAPPSFDCSPKIKIRQLYRVYFRSRSGRYKLDVAI